MSAEKVLRLTCPACAARLGIAPQQRGKQLDCPSCGRRLKIPAGPPDAPRDPPSPARATPRPAPFDDLFSPPSPHSSSTSSSTSSSPTGLPSAAAESDLADEVPVVCGVCHTRMYAPSRQIGQKIRCPDCHAFTEVKASSQSRRQPLPGAAASATRAGQIKDDAEEDEYRLQDAELPWKSNDDATVAVVCEVCHTRLYARPDQIGQYLTCPDCGRLNRIHDQPESPQRGPAMQPAAADMPISAPSVSNVNPFREQADQLLRDADEELDRQERERPEVPPRPMIQGIYSFLWQRSIRVLWIVVSAAFSLVLFILAFLLGSDDPRRLVPGMLMLIVAVPLMIGFLSTQLVAIVYNSSEGHNDLVHPPENHFVDWVADGWLILCALAYACFAGYLLYNVHGSLDLALGVGGPVAFVLYPILFLSMLEIGSRFLPFSGAIWQSLVRHPGSWFMFYVQTAGLMLASAALIGAAVVTQNPVARVVCGLIGSVVVAATVLLYFRLLGRLVLVCGTMDSDYGTVRPATEGKSPARGDKNPSVAANVDADLTLP